MCKQDYKDESHILGKKLKQRHLKNILEMIIGKNFIFQIFD